MLMIDGLAISIIIILMGLLVPITSMVRSDRLKSNYYLPPVATPTICYIHLFGVLSQQCGIY